MQNNIHIEPSYSLTPGKLVLYNRFYYADKDNTWKDSLKIKYNKDNLKRNFHGFELSENANRNLKKKINWLYFLSKKRKITTYNKKTIFNFKIAFLTLTLPARQKHPTSKITKVLFNQFLTEIREKTKMTNYVWRLEFQKNGNVHYHLVTDTYIDYYQAKSIWNRILKKLNYIRDYRNKFKNLSILGYNDLVNKNKRIPFSKIKERYIKNKKAKWLNPNTVDVRSVVSGKNIAGYISKYFSKSSKTGKNCNYLDNENNSKNIRLWFCSRNLSKLDTVKGPEIEAPFNIYDLVKKAKDFLEIKAEYCTIVYFDLKNIFVNGSHKLKKLLFDYANKNGYFNLINT